MALRTATGDSAPTSPETSLISDRIFLAFDTGRGLAYVQVSGKQRAYLLWTFRNFRSLPLKILNTRQRKLVDNLYRSQSILEGASSMQTPSSAKSTTSSPRSQSRPSRWPLQSP